VKSQRETALGPINNGHLAEYNKSPSPGQRFKVENISFITCSKYVNLNFAKVVPTNVKQNNATLLFLVIIGVLFTGCAILKNGG